MPLAHQPLALVLAQVKFSPIRQIAEYVPAIQEAFRRGGYPIERSGKVQQVVLAAQGSAKVTEHPRWEYRTREETRSALLLEDGLVLQTTAYDRFENLAEQLAHALGIVLKVTEHDKLGVVQRVGLRYVNLIRPRVEHGYRYYLQSGFHGAPDAAFEPGTHRVHVQSVGQTALDGERGTLVIRVSQTEGLPLPADLLVNAPKHSLSVSPTELVTLLDMDHFVEGSFEPSSDWVTGCAYALHDHVIESFHEHVITPEAIEVWK